MRLSVAIQHHPRRAELLPALLAELGDAEVVTDPDWENALPSPWRCYRHALETTPARATHRLIVQDDVQVCRSFRRAAQNAIRARPDRLVAFFVGGEPADHARAIFRAHDQEESWAELRNDRWCPAVALCWPAHLIPALLAFVDAQGWPPGFRADDEIIGRWLRDAALTPLATVPSLVEHPDREPSLLHRRAMAGADRGRIAACWIHPDCDPLSIDWTLGPS